MSAVMKTVERAQPSEPSTDLHCGAVRGAEGNLSSKSDPAVPFGVQGVEIFTQPHVSGDPPLRCEQLHSHVTKQRTSVCYKVYRAFSN